MRVLNVVGLLDPVTGGGTAERTIQMSRFLAKNGNQCKILTTDVRLKDLKLEGIDDVKIIALPSINERFFIPMVSIPEMIKLINGTDIIHLMNHWSVLNAIVYVIAQILRKPYVVCPAGALMIFGRSRLIKKLYNIIVGKRIVRNANKCIAITHDEIEQFKDYGVPDCNISVIPNGIDVKKYSIQDGGSFKKEVGIGDAPFILFMGRLNRIKGPDLLLEAFCSIFSEISEYHLVLAGPDEGLMNELKEIAKKYQLTDRVHFPGHIGGVHKNNALKEADLMVIPSRQEAMSIVVLESGVVGTPVLITDSCGFNQIEDLGCGYVVNTDKLGLEDGLCRALKNKHQLKLMGEKLKKFVKQNYAWSYIIDDFISLFKQCIT
jgi:glycosyltransferase involved in cell wall biosynthesis